MAQPKMSISTDDTTVAESVSAWMIDAALVALARDGDEVLTSDPADIARLSSARGVRAFVTPI